jgi:hypothetical protein
VSVPAVRPGAGTNICDDPVVARRVLAPRRLARRRLLEAKAEAELVRLADVLRLPAAEEDGPEARALRVDAEVVELRGVRRPADELAQAVAVRDHVRGRPVERRAALVDGREEREERVRGELVRVLVDVVRPRGVQLRVLLGGERDGWILPNASAA